MKAPSPRLLQLYAMRAQLEALIAGVEAEEQPPEPDPSTLGCPHPEEQQRDASTGGRRRIFCLACQTERDA